MRRKMFSSKTLSELQDCKSFDLVHPKVADGHEVGQGISKSPRQWVRGGKMRERRCREKGARQTSLHSLEKNTRERKSPEKKTETSWILKPKTRITSDSSRMLQNRKRKFYTLCSAQNDSSAERDHRAMTGQGIFLRLLPVSATEEMKRDLVRPRLCG